ncbi:MAG: hypothetical protein ABIX28_18355, partial [Vicinamibacterales bacterium]
SFVPSGPANLVSAAAELQTDAPRWSLWRETMPRSSRRVVRPLDAALFSLALAIAIVRTSTPPMADQRSSSSSYGAREADAFALHKPRCGHAVEAVCEVWRDAGGWRLQVMVSDTGVKWSATGTSEAEKRATIDTWRVALVERGWA